MKVQRGGRVISTVSLTSALDVRGWLTPRPGRFNPGKGTRYPLYRRLGGPQGRSGQVRKFWPRRGFDPRTVQLVVQEIPCLSWIPELHYIVHKSHVVAHVKPVECVAYSHTPIVIPHVSPTLWSVMWSSK
jgi:hypothetical protein